MHRAPLEYNKPIRISPLVTRVLANNGSFMTGPGTNTYIIGNRELAVIDPGPISNRHLLTILDAVGLKRRIKWIFITHSHPDHSPGALNLQAKTGAELFGLHPQLQHHENIETNEFRLKVIHTPGHASDHLCFLLENENILFSGDHIMQGSTVVIIPPSGHMRSYLNSLKALKAYAIDKIAPGHGHVIDSPLEEIDGIIKHRMAREGKVLSILQATGRAGINHLLPRVYNDVPSFMHCVASYSLEAHLIKLEEDNVVRRDNNNDWSIN